MGGLGPGGGQPGIAQALEQAILKERVAREQREAKERREEVVRFYTDVLSQMYDRGATYTTLVAGAGYVGFFAVWGWVQPFLARWEVLTTALLIGFSLLVFIVWQVYAMMVMGLQHYRLAAGIVAAPQEFDAVVKKHTEAENKERVRLTRLWPVILGLSAIPGLAGGILLLFACARHLIEGSPAAG